MSGYQDPAEAPLFGEARPRDRVMNLIVGVFTALLVVVTLVTAVIFPWPPNGVNIFFAFTLLLLSCSHSILITLISSFAWMPENHILRGMNVYFVICIVLICGSHILLIYWYRQGDLEPKFRNLIYFNAFCIILLCICANLYIHPVAPLCDRDKNSTLKVSNS